MGLSFPVEVPALTLRPISMRRSMLSSDRLDSSKGWDRPSLGDAYSDRLIQDAVDQCNNAIVVIHNAGVHLVDRWVDHANIFAVIYAHLPARTPVP
ncbi:beta-glucosidase M [Penicillium canescens]|nr:beta-glucosidase M [Penicillium canescens]